MQGPSTTAFPLMIGLDLGADCERIEKSKAGKGRSQLTALFGRFPSMRIAMETSTSTRWIHNLAVELGHRVIMANPRGIPIITVVSACAIATMQAWAAEPEWADS